MKTEQFCNRAAAKARGVLKAGTTLAMVLTLSSCGLWNDMMGITDEPVTTAVETAKPQAQAVAETRRRRCRSRKRSGRPRTSFSPKPTCRPIRSIRS
ncbi:MAG: hypothetical protein R3C97_13625 [Geminicoccaceae bacterium]